MIICLWAAQGQIDNPADISREEQDDLIVSYTVNFLDSLTPDTVNVPAAVDAGNS